MRCFKNLIISAFFILVGMAPSFGWTFETSQGQMPLNTNLSWQEVLNYAQDNFSLEGQLIVKSDGFGYLKVSDDYIHALFPMLGLKEEGYNKPPYFRTEEAPGAHISIFYVNENIMPEEVGQYFHFELKQIVIVESSKDTRYVVLQVESPELEKLREKYGLSPKLFGHDYHISLAKKITSRMN